MQRIDKLPGGWKQRTALLSLVVLLVIAGVLGLNSMSQGPYYQGKPLTFWLQCAETNGYAFYAETNPPTRECRQAIRSMGTNAIPPLLRILRSKDSAVKTAIRRLVYMQNYVEVRFHSVEQDKERAALGFVALGDLGTNAVAALIDIFQHPSSAVSQEIAEATLMRLFPSESVSVPYWLAPGKRAQWYMTAGEVLTQSGLFSNAIVAFSQAIQLEPTNVAAYVSRGEIRGQLQDFTAARIDFEQAMTLSPSNAPAVCGRGLCKYNTKDFKGAEADFTRALALDTNDCNAANYRGLARANMRDFKGAQADFSQALAVSSYEPTFYRNRAMAEAMETEYELALADASKSLELDKSDPATWELRGRIQTALKNFQAAVSDTEKAIQLQPKNSSAYAARGTAYLLMDDFAHASPDIEAALRLNPMNASAFLSRGVLEIKNGDDTAALADLQHAVKLRPEAPEVHGLLGMLQYKLSQWEPALTNCRLALKLGAITSVSGYNGCVWLIRAQSGQQQAANKELNEYLASLDSSKTNEWSAITARFLTDKLPETNFLALATTVAKRPCAVIDQVCDSFYYAAMKRKLAGDKAGARQLLQKCRDTKASNNTSYWNAEAEMRRLSGS